MMTVNKGKWLKENQNLIISVLLLAFTITLFGPIELYYTNYEEFWFTLKDILLISGALFVLLFCFCLIVGMLLRGRARDVFGCLVFSVGLALYIQGNFANINYGVLDGEEILWENYKLYAAADTLGWLLIIIGCVVLWKNRREAFYKIQKTLAVCVILIQIVTLGTLFITTPSSMADKSDYYLSDEGLYEVSSNENIIIFILDAFDEAYFQELLEEEPEKYNEMFDGFTHFSNAVAGGAKTKIGVPAIITGEPYPGKISYQEYIDQMFNSDDMYVLLQQNNYDTRIYTESSFVPDNALHLVNNQVATGYVVSSYSELAQKYLSLTLYRYVPHILKRFFWIYTGDFDQYRSGGTLKAYEIDDAAYMEGINVKGLTVNQNKNVLRMIHLNGVHPPYELDEYAQFVGKDNTTQINQAKGTLYILDNYIKQLKSMGVYDKTTIIVMADHGYQNESAHGILLVKKKELETQGGMMIENDAPVSYYDLHATILNELNASSKDTFFDIAVDANRQRYFYLNKTESGNMSIVEYVVDGNINEENTIHETGRVLTPDLSNKQYQYGTLLTFGAENTATNYIIDGLSSTDMEFSWSDGDQCIFEFELERLPEKNLMLMLDIMTIYGENGPQRVNIYANGKKCVSQTLTSGTKMQIVIPGAVIADDKKLKLQIDLPDAIVPAELFGEGYDRRKLGIALQGLSIMETEEEAELFQEDLPVISSYTFGSDGTANSYLIDGWYEPEEGHVWSGKVAQLLVKTSKICDYDIALSCFRHNSSVQTMVYVNDNLITTLEGDKTDTKIRVSKSLLNEDGNQILRFETPDAISPKEAGENEDERILGICLYGADINSIE